jgi:hypothetical protein
MSQAKLVPPNPFPLGPKPRSWLWGCFLFSPRQAVANQPPTLPSLWRQSVRWGGKSASGALWALLAIFLQAESFGGATPAPTGDVPIAANALPTTDLKPGTSVAGARVEITADEGFRVLLDGREIARQADLALRLPLGAHVLAVEAVNVSANTLSAVVLDPHWGVGAWIWDSKTFDKQTCRLWRSFVIPEGAKVARAHLDITADNGFRVLLDGREIGRGSDWRNISEFDLTWLLPPGRHALAVEAFNDAKEAGVLAGLKIDLMDGPSIEIPSDPSWRIVPEEERGWEDRREAPAHWRHAVVAGEFKGTPWASLPAGVTRLPPLHPVELHFWNRGWFQVALLSVCGLTVLACLQLMVRLTAQAKAQGLLQRERARIARDIHDELGAGLTQLLLLGEVARKEGPPTASGRSGVERLCGKARGLSVALDDVVWAVNSRHDTLRDFARHTCKYAQSFLANSPIRCRLDVESEIPPLPFDLPVRRNLFLAVKEILNNAAKHSGASELFLRIHRRGAEVVVSVEDNGKGFAPVLVDPERNGLTNLKQRMDEISGTCTVTSMPGEGCRVALRVPLSQSRLRPVRWFRSGRSWETSPPEPMPATGADGRSQANAPERAKP